MLCVYLAEYETTSPFFFPFVSPKFLQLTTEPAKLSHMPPARIPLTLALLIQFFINASDDQPLVNAPR